jgi:hypothetical protein
MQGLLMVLLMRARGVHHREEGFSTAELLGNAALGILALVAIWSAMQALGVNVVEWIGRQLGVSGGGG